MTTVQSRALVVETPGTILLADRAIPLPEQHQVLVRPDTVGLCGTDLEIIDGRIDPSYVRYPIVLGHEWSGIVAQGGGEDAPAGARVVIEGIVPCGQCGNCRVGDTNLCDTYDEFGFTRDGAAADYLLAPSSLVHPVASSVTRGDAALVEPASVVYRALTRTAIRPGCRILVVGDGTVALLAVHLLRLWSPAESVVLGLRPGQAELAAAAGATRFEMDPTATGKAFDLVIEAAGTTAAALTAVAAARRGATVVLLGLPPHGETAAMALSEVVNNDLVLQCSFSYTAGAWRQTVALLNAGLIRPGFLVTHQFLLEDWRKAIETLRGAESPRGKVLLKITGRDGQR